MSDPSPPTEEKVPVPLWDFWNKHAMPPMLCPSCLVCGQTTPPERAAITHMELPGIVVCFTCRDRATKSPEPVAPVTRDRPRFGSGDPALSPEPREKSYTVSELLKLFEQWQTEETFGPFYKTRTLYFIDWLKKQLPETKDTQHGPG